ncbi:TolC family protein [Microbulbifer yueqingensis]|uniref:Outer membrane protein TolC n=1 Tax=Microbulbifer yueqingensis TaxID=658219 RepID=A0A1G9BPI4_9GAMM|nr:TolC family protein [Microbulbifer yueqingensis]SDK41170.1 Outer membrane protein TolC [Microbulbifer yueqingensis]
MYPLFRTLGLVAALLAASEAPLADQTRSALDLQQALDLALQQDPGPASVRQEAEARQAEAIAAGEWDDPVLKLGAANVPVDSFAFDEQPMTQKVVGLRQLLPRGDSARLARERGSLLANAGFASADDRVLQLARDVSREFLTLAEQLRTRELLQDNRRWLEELVTYNRARLASARIQSQQLLQSQLAVTRLDDRIAAVEGRIITTRGRLARWLGNAAWAPVETTPPRWPELESWLEAQSLPVPPQQLAGHPALTAADAQVAAGERGVALAREAYKPRFGLEVQYGQRDTEDASDFAGAAVTFDLPLFTGKRQDQRLAAARARESAGILQRQELLQTLHAGLNAAAARATTLAERRQLYDRSLLDQAEETADAVLRGYASNTADMEAVIAARLDAIEAQISAAQLDYGYFRALAELRYYLAGGPDAAPAAK